MNNVLYLRNRDPHKRLPREAFREDWFYPNPRNLLRDEELFISSIASGVWYGRTRDFARLMRDEWSPF